MTAMGKYLNDIPSKGVSEITKKYYPYGKQSPILTSAEEALQEEAQQMAAADYNDYPIRDFVVGPQIPSTEYLLEQYPYWEQQARQQMLASTQEAEQPADKDAFLGAFPNSIPENLGASATPYIANYLKARLGQKRNQNSGFRL